MDMNKLPPIIFQIGVLLLLPPFLLGIINKTKAWFAGRVGPPVLQVYFDLLRLLRKNVVISSTTTWVFLAAPLVSVISVVLAGLFVPVGPTAAPLHFTGDLILFAYLLALGRFFTTLAALDTGSSFEGMGAAREFTFACFSEPALFLALLVLVKLSGTFSLSTMLLPARHSTIGSTSTAALALVAVGLFVVLLAETSRIPVDDPNTHLELTMIHEVMVLDNSGPLLGAQIYASSVKLLILAAFLLHVLLPLNPAWFWRDWGIMLVGLVAVAGIIGVVESIMARLQLRLVPTLLVAACLLSGFGFLLIL